MKLHSKIEGAGNTLNITRSHYLSDTNDDITTMDYVQQLHNLAFYNVVKHRWDPMLKSVHEEYLNLLSGILKECEE